MAPAGHDHACAPKDQPVLDYEREERAILQAIGSAGQNVAVDSGSLGTFDELRERIVEFQPHVVHLTGHAVVGRQCPACKRLNEPDDLQCRGRGCAEPLADVPALGYFAFEDARGQTDLRSSVEIRQRLFAGSGVQCVFVSGCQSGKAPPVAALGGICQGLLSDGVPLAIGFAASIADRTATRFATTFYHALAHGQAVDRALVLGRQEIRQECEDAGDPSWTLPVLYAATAQALVFDPDLRRPAAPPPRPSMVQQPLPGMTEGYAEHFVGRRREIQRLLPALEDGSVQTVLITGLPGAGKSTLATHLVRKLETAGFTPIPIPSSSGAPLSSARLLETCGDAFLAAGLGDAHATLRNERLPATDRLRYVVTALNRDRFVLVLDNFEVNVDEATRRILDEEIAGFYRHLLTHLAGGSRAIITSRYPPADVATLPPKAVEEPLRDFPESDFLKFLLRDEVVERRYYRGELPFDLLGNVQRLLGGTPRFLDQVRKVLREIAADDLRRELVVVRQPVGAEPSALQQQRDEYCQAIFTARLYGYLSPDAQRALSRAAVYGIPVGLAGLAAVAGESTERLHELTRAWQEHALAYPDRERASGELWTVYGLLRGWLLAPERLSPDERRSAHRAAGDFLRELEHQDREGELGLTWVDCLPEARAQYLAAGDGEPARAVTDRISNQLVRRGLYDELVRLNRELLEHEEHPDPLGWIARASLDRGAYPTARAKYEQALAMWRSAGDRAGEAATRHNLATIDLNEGQYGPAREKFAKALAIEQQIDDRAGEASTMAQLGIVAAEMGRAEAGLRLVTLSAMLFQSIGHTDLKQVAPWVNALASQLGYTQDQFEALGWQVTEAYQKNRGWGLIAEAFREG